MRKRNMMKLIDDTFWNIPERYALTFSEITELIQLDLFHSVVYAFHYGFILGGRASRRGYNVESGVKKHDTSTGKKHGKQCVSNKAKQV